MINMEWIHLFGCKACGVDGSTDEVLPATTHRKAGLGQEEE